MVHDTYIYFYVCVKSSTSARELWKTTLYLSNQFFVTVENSGWAIFFSQVRKKQAEKWTPQIASVCLRLLSSGLRSLGWVYLLIALLNCNYSRQLFGSQHCFIGFINHTNYYPIENCNYPQTLTCQNVY